MRAFVAILLLSFVCISAQAQKSSGRRAVSDETRIRNILNSQVVNWNLGNVEGYMKGYWESDSLLFIGKSGPTYGFKATLDRYKKSYPDATAMGTLTSTILTMERLAPDCFFIVGKWKLKRTAGDLGGSWTLLLKKKQGEWVIVADHSS